MDTTSDIKSDDAAFVDSVMSSQSVVAVENVICTQNTPNHTPSADTRKRHLSTDSEDELPTKRGPGAQKSRDNQDLFELMTAGFLDLKRDLASTLDSKFQDFESRLKSAIMVTVREEIESVQKELNDRIDGLSKSIEDKIQANINKKVSADLQKVKSDIKSDIKSELKKDTKQLQDDVSKLRKSYADAAASVTENDSLIRNIVIRNLKIDQRESSDKQITVNKVNTLFRDGLKLTSVKVTAAERKQTRDGKPGLIIATVETAEQKSSVMQRKKNLRKTKHYESVYLEDERPSDQRLTESNMRTLLKACGKSNDYIFSNGRLFQKKRSQNS